MSANPGNEISLSTSKGEVRIRSFCTPDQIRNYAFDAQFATHAQYKSLYTQRESLERDATLPDANVVLALTPEDHIIGFGVLAYPDDGERWLKLGPGLMIEVRVIEVSRQWRSARLGAAILEMMLSHPQIEEKITYMVGYSWTWDLDGTELKAQAYRQVLIKLFERFGFQEYETNEPNICMKHENLFMGRVGKEISDEEVDRFNWLRFDILPQAEQTTNARHKANRQGPSPSTPSLFYPLYAAHLTYLGIFFDWKMDRVALHAARQWDSDVDWSKYGRDFSAEQLLTSNMVCLGHQEIMDLFEEHGFDGYLHEVVGLIKKGRHQGIECFYEPVRDIRIINCMHSNALGVNNGHHAVRSGGIGFHDPAQDEFDLIGNVLNLSRATSFKNAGARLPFGGSRIAVQAGPIEYKDYASIGFISYALDRTRSFMGPDMGFPPELVDVMRREGYSTNITGGFDSKIGPPGRPTAYGVYLALKEAAYAKYGSLNLAGKRVVVQGIGAVGYPLVAEYLVKEEAILFLADINADPIDKLKAKYPGQIQMIDPETVYTIDADILLPCAKSGVIGEGNIDQLKYAIVLGGANNTLEAGNQIEEIRLAKLLNRRGIFFQIDWLHNTAGIICGAEEYVNRGKASLENVIAHVEKVCRDGVREHLKTAAEMNLTPTEHAYRHYNKLVYN